MSWCSTTDIYIQSRAIDTFKPGTFEEQEVCTDVITLMPHQSFFDKHILIRFPFRHPKPGGNLTLMYSDSTSETDDFHWVLLAQNGFSCKHSKSTFWFSDDRYCYVFTQSFSHFVVSVNAGQEEKQLMLSMSLYGKWNPDTLEELALAVSFCCEKCLRNQPVTFTVSIIVL